MNRASQIFGSPIQSSRTAVSLLRDGLFLLALLVPFVAQAFPYGFPLFLPCAAAACAAALVCAGWGEGVAALRIGGSLYLLLMTCALLLFLYGILLTTQWDALMLGETINALAAMVLWIAAVNSPWHADRMELLMERLMACLMWLSAMLAALGLFKFMLLLHGRKLSLIASASSGVYPWGTSLTSDYNMYALTMLAGALAAVYRMSSERRLMVQFMAAFVLLEVVLAGFLSGSRRFWVVAPPALLMLFVSAARRYGLKSVLKKWAILLVFVAVIVLVVAHQFGSIDWKRVGLTGLNLQVRLGTLLDSDKAGGLDSRFVRWRFAFSLIEPIGVWTGSGFDYLRNFGCEYEACRHASYPHNPIISGLLYAGIPGMLSVIALFAYCAYSAARLLGGRLSAAFLSTLMITHLAFILISSNGPFAVKSALTVTILCTLYLALERQRGTAL